MDGLVDCAAPSTPYSDRLATIIRRRHAWAAMEWNDTVSVHLPGECLAYELVADVLAKLTETHKFACVELPSMPRAADTGQIDTSSIDTWDLPFAARDFAMDPTQDLVIFLEDTRMCVKLARFAVVAILTYEACYLVPSRRRSREIRICTFTPWRPKSRTNLRNPRA